MANLQYFSTPYQTLITGSSATKRYVDAALGSNSNNGTSETSAWLTFDYALSQTAATASEVMIIVNPGLYTVTPSANANASYLFTDGNYARKIVCAPSQVRFQWTSTGARDAPMVDLQNAGSAMYGAILLRDNSAKTLNYAVGVFNGSTANLKGNFFNCVFRETNANNQWSLQYDNSSVISSQVNNCTFYFNAASAGDYSGGGGLVLNNCAFNQVNPGGSSNKNNTVYSQTVNATTYAITGVSTQGVYSGTYDWSLPYNQFGVSFTVNGLASTAVNEGQTLVAVYNTTTTSTFTASYAITGTIVISDITTSSTTGTITVTGGVGSLSIPIIADSTIEGTEFIYVTIGGSTSGPITIYDTSAPLTVIPPTGVAGTPYVITLTTSSANGTQFPYTITGTNISSANLGSQITGTFVINNNSATFTLRSASVASSTFYVNVPSLGIQQSGLITYAGTLAYPVTPQGTSTVASTLMQSNGSSPIPGQAIGQYNPLPSTGTYILTGVKPVPGLSLFQINFQSTSTSTYTFTGQYPIPSIMQGSTQAVSPPQLKITSQADTGYGNAPVTPLGQPLVNEFWL